MGVLEDNKNFIQAGITFIVLAIFITLLVPLQVDDTTRAPLYDSKTGDKIYYPKVSTTAMLLYLFAILAAIYIVFLGTTEEQLPKIRSVIDAWADIPDSDIIKHNLPTYKHLSLQEANIYPTGSSMEKLVKLRRGNDTYHIMIYVGEDLKKKFTSPILSIIKDTTPTNVAFSLLNKRSRAFSDLSYTLRKAGLPPGQVSGWLAQAELEKQRKLEEQPSMEG